TRTAGPAFGHQDVVLFGGARARAELRVFGFPTAHGTNSHGNPERALIQSHFALVVLGQSLVQRLYGHRLNQDGMAKIQSSPRTLKGGGESRRGKKPRVAGSNPAGRTAKGERAARP